MEEEIFLVPITIKLEIKAWCCAMQKQHPILAEERVEKEVITGVLPELGRRLESGWGGWSNGFGFSLRPIMPAPHDSSCICASMSCWNDTIPQGQPV